VAQLVFFFFLTTNSMKVARFFLTKFYARTDCFFRLKGMLCSTVLTYSSKKKG